MTSHYLLVRADSDVITSVIIKIEETSVRSCLHVFKFNVSVFLVKHMYIYITVRTSFIRYSH